DSAPPLYVGVTTRDAPAREARGDGTLAGAPREPGASAMTSLERGYGSVRSGSASSEPRSSALALDRTCVRAAARGFGPSHRARLPPRPATSRWRSTGLACGPQRGASERLSQRVVRPQPYRDGKAPVTRY